MGMPWRPMGRPTGRPGTPMGLSHGTSWDSHETSRATPRYSMGIPWRPMWTVPRDVVGLPWDVPRDPTLFHGNTVASHVDPWESHRTSYGTGSHGTSWDSHGTSRVTPRYSMGIPWRPMWTRGNPTGRPTGPRVTSWHPAGYCG